MAIWTNLLKRIIGPVVNEEINKAEQNKGKSDGIIAQPLNWPLPSTADEGPVTIRRFFPRGVRFQTLRDLAFFYPILRACVNYRKRQITQLSWDISPIEVQVDEKLKEQHNKDAQALKEFFKYPTGDKTMTLRTFVNKIVEDLIVLDAIAIYRRKNKKGGFYGYLPIDASTIQLMLNPDGTIPTPPETAYKQMVGGKEITTLTTDELIYGMLNPRTDSPYGLSPVEALIVVVTTALKLGSYNLAFLSEGTVPEGFIELPKDIASSPEQLRLWQEAWDTMISGNPRHQRRIKFLPEGMKWTPIRKQDEMSFERFEKWLLLQTCSILEVAPQTIGFQFERGKGATESEWEIGKERGLFPLAHFLKELFDQMIQDDLGQKHLEFVWTNINPTNKKEEADVFGMLVKSGAVSVDEWRLGEGMKPIGMPHYIMTPTGPVLVKDLIGASEAGQQPFIMSPQPNKALTPAGKPPEPKSTEAKPTETKPTAVEAKKGVSQADILDELKRWNKVSSNDYKQGKAFRDFKTDILDIRVQSLIKNGLKTVKTKEDIDALFQPFLNQETQVVAAMLELYDEINGVLKHGDKETTQNQTIA